MSLNIKGTEELSRRLKGLKEKVARREAVRILKKGAPPIKKEMKKLAPEKTGRLRKSIVTRRGKKNRRLGETVLIGPKGGKKGAPYAHIVELGARGGTYTAKGSGMFSIIGPFGIGRVSTKTIERKALKGQGFIRKSFANKSKEAERRIALAIKKIVES
jgi:HK97 gp10 family phage protein|tara:strand:+ start:187 stop:663 length:477 start_codon:yes stop_codon:yes gene_type:complete